MIPHSRCSTDKSSVLICSTGSYTILLTKCSVALCAASEPLHTLYLTLCILHPCVCRDRTEPGTRQGRLNIERLNECEIAFVYCVEWKKQRHARPSLFTVVHPLESKHLSGREAGLGAALRPLADLSKSALSWTRSSVPQTRSSDSHCRLPARSIRPPTRAAPQWFSPPPLRASKVGPLLA